jgi:hypothetical protein
MPNIVWTLLVATVTALVTTIATGVLVIPRLEARKRRIQEAHTARDTFNSSLLTIISACNRLQSLPLPAAYDPDCTEVVRARLAAERERWMQQMDDATRWLIDHVETYAAGWPLVGHGGFPRDSPLFSARSGAPVMRSRSAPHGSASESVALGTPCRTWLEACMNGRERRWRPPSGFTG